MSYTERELKKVWQKERRKKREKNISQQQDRKAKEESEKINEQRKLI
jgi:hypothetical protein